MLLNDIKDIKLQGHTIKSLCLGKREIWIKRKFTLKELLELCNTKIINDSKEVKISYNWRKRTTCYGFAISSTNDDGEDITFNVDYNFIQVIQGEEKEIDLDYKTTINLKTKEVKISDKNIQKMPPYSNEILRYRKVEENGIWLIVSEFTKRKFRLQKIDNFDIFMQFKHPIKNYLDKIRIELLDRKQALDMLNKQKVEQ